MVGIFRCITHQPNRMECYTVVALLVALLSFSHMLGYWPYGSAGGSSQSINQGAPAWPHMSTPEAIWRVVFVLSLFGIGLLYYFGRRAGAAGKPPLSSAAPIQAVPAEAP